MSSGPADCAAEDRLYRAVWRAVYDLRKYFCPDWRGHWPHFLVEKVNILISDQGYRFELAQYAAPDLSHVEPDADKLWPLAFQLRSALRGVRDGHRGWAPVVDCEVDGLLRGTRYELREVR